MKQFLSLCLLTVCAFLSYGQSQQVLNKLKKDYKNVRVDGGFIMAEDKKSKENCAFTLDGTFFYRDNCSFYVAKDKNYGGKQYYTIKNAYSNIVLALVDETGNTVIPYPDRIEFIETSNNKVFIHNKRIGPDYNRMYSHAEVFQPDGTLIFKSHTGEYLKPIHDNDNLYFIGEYRSGNIVFYRLIDGTGKILIDSGKNYIYTHKIGEKYYFSTHSKIPGETSNTEFKLIFDDKGKNLPGIYDKYIELDGDVFFILQKYSKGFNGKIEPGEMYVYSPNYGDVMSWEKTDKSLAVKTEDGKKMLVKTSESGTEEKVALGNADVAHSKLHEKAEPENKSVSGTPACATVSEIDNKIPKTTASHPHTFALIIANENYRREEKVPFALNDGQIFAEYLKTTLGVPEKNIQLYTDASLNDIKYGLNRLSQICDAFGKDASVIVYYAGHGIPDEKTLDAHLLPVDGYGSDATTGYSLKSLYETLSALPSKQTVLLLDACFSGSQRSGKMMTSNARGVRLKPKNGEVGGNLIVLSATQGDETAYPYEDQGHGLFTYFLLKKLNDNKGTVTLGELSDYIIDNVKRVSVIDNEKIQTPTVKASTVLSETWRRLPFGE